MIYETIKKVDYSTYIKFQSNTKFSINTIVAINNNIIINIAILVNVPLFLTPFSNSSNPSKSDLLNDIELV